MEVGRKLQRARQQFFGITITPEPRRDLCHHPDCCDIDGVLAKPRAKTLFCNIEPVLLQGKRQLYHRGIALRRVKAGGQINPWLVQSR